MEYPWYESITAADALQQGDFIPNCPIVIPPDDIPITDEGKILEIQTEIQLIDSVILTQSCDLVNGKVSIVLVCPHYPLNTFLDSVNPPLNSKGKAKKVDELKKGYLPGYHLLNKSDTHNIPDYQVVDFKNVYGIQYTALKSYSSRLPKRNRLLPPYREHLSQAFARYFMRVGLPQDLIVSGY